MIQIINEDFQKYMYFNEYEYECSLISIPL